jgi:N6-L-threonylcarbamoyladenine synthase
MVFFNVFTLIFNLMSITILGIESSCDDTSASVLRDGVIHSNITATQTVHMAYGGVVPELASRAHQQNIIPVVDQALKKANVTADEIDAVAFTRGPGLLGSLMVGTSFAKGFALSKNIPLIEVNHLKAHILAHFIDDLKNTYDHPNFPFIALLVSGGNSQIIVVKDHMEMEVIGETIDDAAGEAFDKCAKVIGIPYPGGPMIDKRAKEGNPLAFEFNKPKIQGLNYSFSGLKTSFLYLIRDKVKENPNFIEENMNDICASIQYTIVDVLMNKVKRAVRETGIKEVAIAGGVSANSGLQNALKETAVKHRWTVYIPQLGYSLDNAAMVAITGYFKYLKKDFVEQDTAPFARMTIK